MSDGVRSTARELLRTAIRAAQAEGLGGDSILPQRRQRVEDWRTTWAWEKTSARLPWVEAIRQILENAVLLLGVSAPQEMKRAESTDEAEAH